MSGTAALRADAPPQSTPASSSVETPDRANHASPPVENFITLSPRLYSGGEPDGDKAFDGLAARGVKTIVSVDGARPDVAAAKRHGLRYVHIPIGYDGVDRQAQLALVRIMRESPGAVFVHCHHGKHRGPAAAAVACLATGDMTAAQAEEYLTRAGTGKEYAGLWRDVAGFKPPAADENLPALVEVAKVDDLAAGMAVLDRHWDGLKLCEAADWTAPPEHADLTPPHQALLVWEALRESQRAAQGADADLLGGLQAAERSAQQLREALTAKDKPAATRLLARLNQQCQECHAAHRN